MAVKSKTTKGVPKDNNTPAPMQKREHPAQHQVTGKRNDNQSYKM